MMPTQGASCLFFLPITFGSIPCSLAREATRDGALNEAEKATPKILISIPTMIDQDPGDVILWVIHLLSGNW